MFKTIALALIMLIAIVLIYASTKPDSFHVERSTLIKVGSEKIFPSINDFHQWENWTPYNKDPAMKRTYNGADSGKGAHYAWEGNKEVGKGEITITDAQPSNKIRMKLHMIEPFEASNDVAFTLATEAGGTRVVWGMDGQSPFIMKLMGLFINMDKMVGKDFEVGLARLKTLAEK
jgi:uncharacterized protein YndB with AHSA1/START domain